MDRPPEEVPGSEAVRSSQSVPVVCCDLRSGALDAPGDSSSASASATACEPRVAGGRLWCGPSSSTASSTAGGLGGGVSGCAGMPTRCSISVCVAALSASPAYITIAQVSVRAEPSTTRCMTIMPAMAHAPATLARQQRFKLASAHEKGP